MNECKEALLRGPAVLRSPLASSSEVRLGWITGGLTEKYTPGIMVAVRWPSGPPDSKTRGYRRGEESCAAITPLSSFSHLLPSSCLFTSPPLLQFPLWCLFCPLTRTNHFTFSPFSFLYSHWVIPRPPLPPPLLLQLLSFMPSSRGINKWLLKGYQWSEKPDVSLCSRPPRPNAVLVSCVFTPGNSSSHTSIAGRGSCVCRRSMNRRWAKVM